MDNFRLFLMDILYKLPALFIAFSFHEFAHAYVADRLGDPTPRNQGRLTLDPLTHIDLIGFVMLLVAGFGWAKPVQINPSYFKDKRKGQILVSIAGPGMNFILAFLSAIILHMFNHNINTIVFNIVWYIFFINILLGVFNLLPIPPLDGSKILFNVLPSRYRYRLMGIERYGFLILIILVITGAFSWILYPIISVVQVFINSAALRLVYIFKIFTGGI